MAHAVDQVIKEKAQEFLSLLQTPAEVSVGKEEDCYLVEISGNDLGVLIGYHGERLRNFQLLLSLLVYHELDAWENIRVDVDGWAKKREQYLIDLAKNTVQKVRLEKKAVTLPFLTGAERRTIHMIVNEEEGVSSSSVGEGDQRRLIVQPKE
ncbi:MAG TPA: R3H domain-containing nucleic acid-binding protein [Patescibacteria group bacterium]|nr:R3H domain-containing nucleic acid-binding protein [Patescibacteria group bacterium]